MDLFSQNYNLTKKYKFFEPFLRKEYKGTYYYYFFDWEKEIRTKRTTKTKNQPAALKEFERFKKNYFKGVKSENIKNIMELRDMILHYYKHTHSAKTLEIYVTAFKKLMSVIGNKELRQVTLKNLEDFKLAIAEKTSKITANIYLRTLKSAFYFALKLGVISENPFTVIKQFPIPEREKLSFEPEELKVLFDAIEEPYLKRIVFFALYSGARIGEILNIQWYNISTSKNWIHISNKNDFLTKTRRERHIPLSAKLKQIIDDDPYSMHEVNRSRQQALNFEAKNVIELDHKREKDYTFGKPNGMKFSTGYISKVFKECLRKAGLDEKFHFHCLRHTAITNMALAGIPALVIKEIVGHNDLKTTQGYCHPTLNDMRTWLENVANEIQKSNELK